MIFQEKCFSQYIPITDQIYLPALHLEILVDMCVAMACWKGSDVINYEI